MRVLLLQAKVNVEIIKDFVQPCVVDRCSGEGYSIMLRSLAFEGL